MEFSFSNFMLNREFYVKLWIQVPQSIVVVAYAVTVYAI